MYFSKMLLYCVSIFYSKIFDISEPYVFYVKISRIILLSKIFGAMVYGNTFQAKFQASKPLTSLITHIHTIKQ